MANTLTSLLPDLYEAIDVVQREMVGFIPSVTLDATAERAAVGQAIRVPITPAAASRDNVPGQLPPNDGNQNIGNRLFTISKSKGVPFNWTGEEQKGVNTGPGYQNIRRDQITQAIRTLVNSMEIDVAGTYVSASRAWGASGTTPFQNDLSDPANLLKILKDNGAGGDFNLVIDTTAGAKLRSLAQLTKANEAGTTALREKGVLLDIHGFKIRESAGIQLVSTGSGSGYSLNGIHLVGATTLNLQSGTGSIIPGDILMIGTGAAAKQYVVAASLGGGVVTINAPGLMNSYASTTPVVVSAPFTPNMAFARSAIVLATRAPAVPVEGDMASDEAYVTDPVSGITFRFAMYKQFLQVHYEVQAAWGVACIKPEFTAILKG